MYLSRAELDTTRRSTMIALTSPQKFHGAVENSFSGERRRRLWRLDSLNGKLYLLLLSEELPDLTGLCAQFGTGAAPEMRRYGPLLERVTPGSCWQFRLTANPTRTRKDPADPLARGALKPCYLEAEQEQWLLEQAGKHGFALTEGTFQVTRKQTCHFRKNGKRPVTLLAVTYEGILQVTDPEAFREMLCQGIGRGNLPEHMGILHHRRKEIQRLHNGQVLRQPVNSRVIRMIVPHQKILVLLSRKHR